MSRLPAASNPSVSLSFVKEAASAYEQIFVPHLGDALRLVVLLAIPAAWIISGPLSALTMLLVSGGTWALRYYSSSRSEDLAGQIVLLLGGAFSVLGTYKVVEWLDLVVHLLMLAVLTKTLANMLVHHAMLPDASNRRQATGFLVAVTGLGVLLALLWEIGEWAGHTFINPEVGVGYEDTLGDLVAGSLGSLMAAFWFHRSTRFSRPS
ncbi:hypothetical protein OIU93_04145 [Paeniglutamicibacter sp. ZC-3]|uniref:hypothetical protein n=1 Tax=Paeniglutamicibacter sp. ZC-3 TaxID=2986919 RepID=UPI0021F6D33A|nr:hypothetical protein [Paeniglutamicibacter sp. ZC-3]MCV9993488.1 hypothetical protein [Paeniglutamicibacter sp. ZC-3]